MSPRVSATAAAATATARAAVLLALASAVLVFSCRLERPDPASQAAAILHKHPSDFLDQLASLDALAAREAAFLHPDSFRNAPRPLLAESLYAYGSRLRPAMAGVAGPQADSLRVALLNAFLFDSLGIVPDLDGGGLAGSVPSLVLARRKGTCVGLVLLYLALGRSLGMPMAPVFLPGHVFVRYRPAGGGARGIETLRRGIARSDSFYRETFALGKRPWYSLADAAPEQALAALVFNLANAHLAAGDPGAAEAEYRLTEEALPGFPEALGCRGVCFLLEGRTDSARARFTAALAGDSLSAPALRNLEILDRGKAGP